MDLQLKDKVVVMTGVAGRKGSIGETMLQAFAEEGAIPVIIDRNVRGLSYAADLQSKGIDASFHQTDVTDPQQIAASINAIIKIHNRIDIIINNVGVNDGIGLDSSYDEFINSIKLNLASYFEVTRLCLPLLKKSKGNILNIGSKVALTGQGGTSAYAAAKGGILALTREWAVDLIQYGIRSNCIIIAESWTPAYDDWIKTLENGKEKLQGILEKIPLENRMTSTQEIADLALFLTSDRSSHTTGQHVFVDGGYVHLDRALLSTK